MQVETSYEGIEDVVLKEPLEELDFLEPGEYADFEVTGLKDGFTKKDDRQFLAIEGTIHKSSGPKANPAGTRAVVIIKKGTQDAKYGYFLKEVKRVVAALLNEPWQNVTSPTIKSLIGLSKSGQMGGIHVAVTVTIPEGKNFPKIVFKPIEGVTGKTTKKTTAKA